MERYFWIVPAGCAAIAGVFVVVGAVRLMAAQRALQAHVERTREHPMLSVDPARAQAAMERLRAGVDRLEPLLTRAMAALGTIADGLRTLRLPEAVMAIRIAGAAVRALLPR